MKIMALLKYGGLHEVGPSLLTHMSHIWFTICLLLLIVPAYADTRGDIPALQQQVEKQRVLIREQQQQLREQQLRLDNQANELNKLGNRLEKMEKAKCRTTPASTANKLPLPVAEMTKVVPRDKIGDLNAEAVTAGEFPGSILIPGPGRVSLAIGGFIKTIAIHDSKAENMGANFLPTILGTNRSDSNGAFSVDAALTRLHIEASAPVMHGNIRGYVEWDLNSANDGTLGTKWRLAYGSWTNNYGTLTVGQDWSTFMDVKILPEGLTEPTVSGAIFNRQGLIRWSQPLTPQFTYHIAIEDPNSNDFFSDQPQLGRTSVPDIVLGIEYNRGNVWHTRLNGMLREIKVTTSPSGQTASTTGWGLALTGYLNTFGQDKITAGAVYGDALGRYLLGITSIAGASIDPVRNDLTPNKNWGAFVTYRHHWTEKLRSTAMFGYARAKTPNWQQESFFKSSTYGAVNLMWSIQPYLTIGAEYAYGSRESKDGSSLHNNRIAVGIQLF